MAEAAKSTAKSSKKSVKQQEAEETFSIPVRKAAASSVKPEEDSSETKEELKTHHELVLKAPRGLEESEGQAAEDEPTSEESPEKDEPEKPAQTPSETPEKPSELDNKNLPLGAQPAEELQSPTVFDTKQYHLPINESHGGGGARFFWGLILALLLIALAGVIAVDAGWIDLGFTLPFDFIK